MPVSLVAGGAGLIGSRLCRKLLDDRHQVICADNLATATRANLDRLSVESGFSHVACDVTGALEFGPLDNVFHLASPASPRHFAEMPESIIAANSTGTANLIELALEHGARFLFASTSEVYGDPLEHPQREDYFGNVNPVGERACYDESKRFGEALTMTAVRRRGLDGRIVRIFNTYGPGMNPGDGRALIEFLRRAIEGRPLPIHGDGSQTRSWCFVGDLADGVARAMERSGTCGRVYNLGNPDERSVLDLANAVLAATGSDSPLEFLPMPPDDPVRRCPDISRARAELDWQPTVDLEDGLLKTLTWYRQEFT
jgi:nucleoside-diphosphate-sugar epimerase